MKMSVALLFLSMLLTSQSFAQMGIDPLNQTWVRDEQSFSSVPGRTEAVDPTVEGLLKQVKKNKTSRYWSAPAPPRLDDTESVSTVKKNTTFHDLKSQLTDINKDGYGIYYSAKLPDYTRVYINNVPFDIKGSVSFFKTNDHIASFYESRGKVLFPTKYGELPLGNWASFSPRGVLTFACPVLEERDFQVGNITIPYKIVAGKYLSKVFFHWNGNLMDIHIKEDLKLQVYGNSILFAHHEGCGGDLNFYRNESFRGGYLAEHTLIKGTYYPRGAYVEFWDNGQLRAVMGNKNIWKDTVSIQGIRVGLPHLGGGITFTREGKVSGVFGFAEDTALYGQTFRKGQSMTSYVRSDGELVAYARDLKPGDTFYIKDLSE